MWRERFILFVLGGEGAGQGIAVAFACVLSVAAPFLALWIRKEVNTARTERTERIAVTQAHRLTKAGLKDEALSVLTPVWENAPRQPQLLRAIARAGEEDYPIDALRRYRDLEHAKKLTPEDEARMAVLQVRLTEPITGVTRINRLHREHPWDDNVATARQEVKKMLITEVLDADSKINPSAKWFAITPNKLETRQPPIPAIEHAPALLQWLNRVAESYPEPLSSQERVERSGDFRRVLGAVAPTAALEVKLAAVRYLQANFEPQLIADFISRAEALKHEALYTAVMDALMDTQRFKEASSLSLTSTSLVPGAVQWNLRALVELRSPSANREQVAESLRKAIQVAEQDGQYSVIETSGHIAHQHGLSSVAAEAFGQSLRFIDRPSIDVSSYIEAARLGDLKASQVVPILTDRIKKDILDTDTPKRLAYFKLLIGKDLELIDSDIQQWLFKNPEDPVVRMLDALSADKIGDTVRALAALHRLLPCRWSKGEIAVLAGIAARAGQRVDAAKLIEGLSDESLFDEEIDYLKDAQLTCQALGSEL